MGKVLMFNKERWFELCKLINANVTVSLSSHMKLALSGLDDEGRQFVLTLSIWDVGKLYDKIKKEYYNGEVKSQYTYTAESK